MTIKLACCAFLVFLVGFVATAEEPTIYRLASGEEIHGFGITMETKESYFVRDEKGNMQTLKKVDVLEVIRPQPAEPSAFARPPIQKPPAAVSPAKEEAEGNLKRFKQSIDIARQDIEGINEKVRKVEQWANDERFRIGHSPGDQSVMFHDLSNNEQQQLDKYRKDIRQAEERIRKAQEGIQNAQEVIYKAQAENMAATQRDFPLEKQREARSLSNVPIAAPALQTQYAVPDKSYEFGELKGTWEMRLAAMAEIFKRYNLGDLKLKGPEERMQKYLEAMPLASLKAAVDASLQEVAEAFRRLELGDNRPHPDGKWAGKTAGDLLKDANGRIEGTAINSDPMKIYQMFEMGRAAQRNWDASNRPRAPLRTGD